MATIANDDPMPATWLARFGRTAAEQALDGHRGAHGGAAHRRRPRRGSPDRRSPSGQRAAPAGLGARTTRWPPPDTSTIAGLGLAAERFGTGGPGEGDTGLRHRSAQSRTLGLREALLGSHFTATGETDATGGSLALWGRAAQSAFDGREGAFSLDGEATTAMLGTDYARGDWLVGLALMQSEGEGRLPRYGCRTASHLADLPPRTWTRRCALARSARATARSRRR